MIAGEHILISAALRGDLGAAAGLVDQYYQPIYGFLRRLCGNETEASDLTQKTFSRLWKALPGFAGKSTFKSWLHGIAHHVYLDWLRGNGHTEARPDQWWEERPDGRPGPDRQALEADLNATLYAAVETLEADLRETVHLHYYQGLTLEETAQALNLATSTVKYRLRNAIQALQGRMLEPPNRLNTQP